LKPRILLIADVRGWIFERHCAYISKILEKDFVFSTNYHEDHFGYNFDEDAYDLIYPLEFNLLHPKKVNNPKKYVTGIRAHSSWWNWDPDTLKEFLCSKFSLVHVVSERLGKIFEKMLPKEKYAGVVQHGVDVSLFTPNETPRNNPIMQLGWAGNRKAAACKGFHLVEPLGNIDGVELNYCGFVDRNLDINDMAEFHRSIDVYICASEELGEGHNNSTVESACTGNAIITTDNGTVPEFLINEENALIIDREPECFSSAVERLRDDAELRLKLGNAARSCAVERFDWNKKALDYKNMFIKVLNEI